jgi:hypothetical protein
MIFLRGGNLGHHTGNCSSTELAIGNWLKIIMRAGILGSLPFTACPGFQEGQRKESPCDTNWVIPMMSEDKSRHCAILPVEPRMIEAICEHMHEALFWNTDGGNSDIRHKISPKSSSSYVINVFTRQNMIALSGCERVISPLPDDKSKHFVVTLQIYMVVKST